MDTHAQEETRLYANAMCEIVKPMFPFTFNAFENYTLRSVTFSETEMKYLKGELDEHQIKRDMGKRELSEFLKKIQDFTLHSIRNLQYLDKGEPMTYSTSTGVKLIDHSNSSKSKENNKEEKEKEENHVFLPFDPETGEVLTETPKFVPITSEQHNALFSHLVEVNLDVPNLFWRDPQDRIHRKEETQELYSLQTHLQNLCKDCDSNEQ